MRALVWIVEDTWEATVDEAAAFLPRDAEVTLLHVAGEDAEALAAGVRGGLLVLARDGDHSRLGPPSLGPAARFVVDHAPCRVLLVWPDEPPDAATIPPPK